MIKPKILLVAPRFYEGKFQLAILPVTGLGYIAESLKRSGFEIAVLDMNLQYSYSDLRKKILEFKPDFIGLTVMTFSHRSVYALASRIKSEFPHIKIVVGGPHVSTLKEKVLTDCPGIDFGIILEGDRSFVKLCQGEKLTDIHGLIYRQEDEIIINQYNDFITDLDNLSFPKYENFELDKYPSKQIGIITSRGCPYNCIYCPVIAAIGKRFRMRSAQSVVAEIEYWYKNGYREILILDDNFTLIRKRVEDVCDLLIKKDFKGLRFHCPNGVRADKVDRQLLQKMKGAGFCTLAFGVESANDIILKNIKKGEDLATIEKGIKDACELGFDVDLFFIIGSPGETFENVKNSFDLALRYPVRSAKFYNIIPFPTTELFYWLNKNQYLLRSPEEILNNASHYVNEPCFFTPEMSSEERMKAFKMGQHMTIKIRRKYLERKMSVSFFLKRMFSFIYTTPLVENVMNNNRFIVRVKETFKSLNNGGT